MSALSADAVVKTLALPYGDLHKQVAASTTIYHGAMVCLDTSGYAVPAADTAGYTNVLGWADGKVDNSSGSNGDKWVTIKRSPLLVVTSGAAITDEGIAMHYITDDQTTSTTPGNVIAGRVHTYVSATSVYIDFTDQIPLPMAFANEAFTASAEFDCDAANQTTIIPAAYADRMASTGLIVKDVWAVVTEAFGGATEDQGVVTLYDTADNSLSITVTVADAGADAVGDLRLGARLSAKSAGDALTKITSTSRGVYGKVTQLVSGAGNAGKLRVYVTVVPY